MARKKNKPQVVTSTVVSSTTDLISTTTFEGMTGSIWAAGHALLYRMRGGSSELRARRFKINHEPDDMVYQALCLEQGFDPLELTPPREVINPQTYAQEWFEEVFA